MNPRTPDEAAPEATPAGTAADAAADTAAPRFETDLSAEEFSAAVTAVTTAFGDPTRREIYLWLREIPGGVTASEVAANFHVHTNVARHHLEKLAGGGYVDVELSRHTSAGRPSKRYRVTTSDGSLHDSLHDSLSFSANFPTGSDDLLATLLGRALELIDPSEASEMADQVGFEYGLAMAGRIDPAERHRSVTAALATVADALTAHGFAAHAEKDETRGEDGKEGRSFRIVAEHCPFGGAATAHPHVVCAVDRGLIRGMLAGLYGDTVASHEESRPEGDDHCVARVLTRA
ncbi:MAG: helix-turn-helix domain-containing protein [Acidimicrobiia bacterium]|nr:helix-turn-helix domain-containing protein [Acidimicrobiia bacterium]